MRHQPRFNRAATNRIEREHRHRRPVYVWDVVDTETGQVVQTVGELALANASCTSHDEEPLS